MSAANAGPGFRDVALLGGSLLFVAGGLFIFSREGPSPVAVAGTSFFGVCALVSVVMIAEKTRIAASLARPEIVGIEAGTRLEIRRGRFLAMGVALLLAGVAGVWAGLEELGVVFALACATIGAVGVALLVGLLPRGGTWLQFEPEGLRFGRRGWDFLVRWDEIVAVAPGSWQENPVVLLRVREDLLLARLPADVAKRVAGEISSHRTWQGCDFMLMPWAFGVDAVRLARAIARYAADASAREELRPRAALTAGA